MFCYVKSCPNSVPSQSKPDRGDELDVIEHQNTFIGSVETGEFGLALDGPTDDNNKSMSVFIGFFVTPGDSCEFFFSSAY